MTGDSRITCEGCQARMKEKTLSQWARTEPLGNPANVDMGHQMFFTETGRISLCATTARATIS